ncbi:MAG TPA: discoidin domain-containing protein [Gemmatimonadaceae bacterium]|nr:discoidin domain-containing protein [Gemmatimonadaceae bacterium]
MAQPVRGQSNLALHKPATQSSTILPGSEASVCVDGNRTSGWCHTQNEPNPWWQVDLGGSYALTQVVVFNRADAWGARERTIGAFISSDGETWTRIYTHDQSNFEVLRINVGNRSARYVRLQLAASDYMNLLEVEVYGSAAGPSNPPPATVPPAGPAPATGGVRYRVENLVYNAPDIYRNPRNYHDFIVDFASCTLRELNRESTQGLQTTRVLVCRDRSRLTFTTQGPGTLVEYDWVFLDDGKTIAGAYRQGGTFGPSIGGRYQPK